MSGPKSGHAETLEFVSAFLLALHAGRFKHSVTMTTSIDPDGIPRLHWETEGDEDTAAMCDVVESLGGKAVPR